MHVPDKVVFSWSRFSMKKLLSSLLLAWVGSILGARTTHALSCDPATLQQVIFTHCGHPFIDHVVDDVSANCSAQYNNMTSCAYQLVFTKCFGGMLAFFPELKKTDMDKLFNMVLSAFSLDVTYCGERVGAVVNTTGFPRRLGAYVPCEMEMYSESINCSKAFYDKFSANREDPALCGLLKESKECNINVAKTHCERSLVPIRLDPYNPFCPNHTDPADNTRRAPTVKSAATQRSLHLTIMFVWTSIIQVMMVFVFG